MKIVTKVLKVFTIVILCIVLLAAALVGYLTVFEYKPADVESLDIKNNGSRIISAGDSLSVLTFNIGYAGLGKNQDFFMDGGKMVRPNTKSDVSENLNGIIDILKESGSDIYFIQEVDINSMRSYGIAEDEEITGALQMGSSNALNYKCQFVPFPWPPIGKVESGLMTLTNFSVTDAERVSLPVPFSWPLRIANLKRCMLVSRTPVGGKELVFINLHLEAYDSGEGKEAQTKELIDFISAEYAKGNYVIAGGDFNQNFPGGFAQYPMLSDELWTPGTLTTDMLPSGWSFAYDLATPTCRLLNQKYDPTDPTMQHYAIDGYILSPNITLDAVQTLDMGFEFSDHNPVKLSITLQ